MECVYKKVSKNRLYAAVLDLARRAMLKHPNLLPLGRVGFKDQGGSVIIGFECNLKRLASDMKQVESAFAAAWDVILASANLGMICFPKYEDDLLVDADKALLCELPFLPTALDDDLACLHSVDHFVHSFLTKACLCVLSREELEQVWCQCGVSCRKLRGMLAEHKSPNETVTTLMTILLSLRKQQREHDKQRGAKAIFQDAHKMLKEANLVKDGKEATMDASFEQLLKDMAGGDVNAGVDKFTKSCASLKPTIETLSKMMPGEQSKVVFSAAYGCEVCASEEFGADF